jgi:hypothetical protein
LRITTAYDTALVGRKSTRVVHFVIGEIDLTSADNIIAGPALYHIDFKSWETNPGYNNPTTLPLKITY